MKERRNKPASSRESTNKAEKNFRRVLSDEFKTKIALSAKFCVGCVKDAVEKYGYPEIFNADQGSPIHVRRIHCVVQ